jgi:glucose dehydrogenase
MTVLKMKGLALAIALLATPADAQKAANWTHSGGDAGNTKYTALDQINAKTIKRLKIVWRAPALDPAVRAENPALVANNNYLNAPLVMNGVMYISNQIGQVEARDPGTGKVIWREAGFPADGPLAALRSSRGLAVWGEGANARIVTVRGPYLYLLDAKTGGVIPSFGDKGRADLRDDPKNLFYWRTPNPIVVKDVIVIGGQPTVTGTTDPIR